MARLPFRFRRTRNPSARSLHDRPRQRPTLIEAISLVAAIGALGISTLSVVISHWDRSRDVRFSVRSQVRNISTHEQRFGITTVAREDHEIEFRVSVHNWGNVDAKNVTLDINLNQSAGFFIDKSCRVQYGGNKARPCANYMSERDLHVDTLEAGDSIDVRYRYRTRRPSCNGYRAGSAAFARSADRQAQSDKSVVIVNQTGKNTVDCNSYDATVMELLPVAYRERCQPGRLWDEFGGAKSHIYCRDPGGGVEYASFYYYGSINALKRRYRSSGRRVSKRSCRGGPASEMQSYNGRSRPEIRFYCREYQGQAWIHLINQRHHLYIIANRRDGGFKRLFTWVDTKTP